MPSDDWYRNKNWNEKIESDFFAKLDRARSQRDQYLVIQALTLTKNHPDISIRLVGHYFETRTKDFDDVRALLAKAQAHLELGEIDSAMETFRAVLARETEFPKHQTTAYVDYPYIVV